VILVDTSVWVDHLRAGDARLVGLLERNEVLAHPFVIAELALGNLAKRELILGSLKNLPSATVADEPEIMGFIEDAPLFGLGIGFVDAHLLASARLTRDTVIWTRDKKLGGAAEILRLLFVPIE
jgi:predicted nucleic acid-binding protein